MDHTIERCLKKGAGFLKSAGVPEAQISAEEMLSHILGKSRVSLYLDSKTEVGRDREEEFETLLGKRAGRYPLQYLLKCVPFRNVMLKVGEGCLIPRPETELLVEVVLQRLGRTNEHVELLDIGTGSGNIAVSLLEERPEWVVSATDISEEALYYARNNADRNGVGERISILQANFWEGLEYKRFDAIVSNPPYLTHEELRSLQPEVSFEPRLALDGGRDGLDFFRWISKNAKRILMETGHLFFEVGMGQSISVSKIMKQYGFRSIEISKDDAGVERFVSGILIQ
ncbi:MAG: peptide chain release factor N(5)-glutamine methyltransferase [Candidatus Omnitrophica bacterium]|nr:peptide chain release factor N(5)-glutamine methyltransferase [Candidatus Omnitrophota bacterium]